MSCQAAGLHELYWLTMPSPKPNASAPNNLQSCLLQHVNALTPADREAGLAPVWDLVYQAGLQLACTAGCEELMGSLAASCQHYAQVKSP